MGISLLLCWVIWFSAEDIVYWPPHRRNYIPRGPRPQINRHMADGYWLHERSPLASGSVIGFSKGIMPPSNSKLKTSTSGVQTKTRQS